MKNTFILLAAVALSFTACNKSVLTPQDENGVGYIDFALSSDDVIVSTKTVSDDALAEYNVTFGDLWTKAYSQVKGQTFEVTAGTYNNVYAENINVTEAETGNGALRVASVPQQVTVEKTKTATVVLSCVPQSSKLTVAFTDGFKSVFTGYTFSVKRSNDTARADGAVSLSMTENVPVFYNGDASLTYTITGTHAGVSKTFGGTLTLTKGHSLKVIVDQSTDKGGLSITITANDELIADTDQTVTIDPYEPLS